MRSLLRGLALASAVACLAVGSIMAEEKVNLKVGDAAPTFEVMDDTGKTWKSSDVIGKKILVVYFYPADMTGGCTKQACTFRDDYSKLASKNVEVVGVSGDTVKNHAIFKEVHKLNFPLLADEKGEVAKLFGVPVGKGGEFKTKDAAGNPVTLTRGVTTQRWTFVIDQSGKIAYKNTNVNPSEDSKQVAGVVEKLQKKS